MFEAYKIGVKVALINHVSQGLGTIISHFTQAHVSAKNLNKELKEIKLMGLAGAAIGGAGFMGLGLVAKTIDPAKQYVHQLAQMNMAGMNHKEIMDSVAASWNLIKAVPSASVTENLEAIRDLRMVAGTTQHAIEYLPTLQKAQGILGSVLGGGYAFTKGSQAYDMAKALEMKGAVKSTSQFENAADLMTKALVATGGKVNAGDFLTTFKYGRQATIGWNDEFTYKILPTLIQEMKARGGSGASGGAGPGLMSAYAAVVGGMVTQRALSTWGKLGLIDPTKTVMTKDGHLKGLKPGGVIGANEFQASPYQWVNDILRPAMVKHGATTETQQRELVQYLFPNRTSGFIMSQFLTQDWKFERDKKLINQAKGLGGYNELLKTDPVLARMALGKQWESLLATLGYNIMPAYIKGMQWMIDVTRTASKWLHDHSRITKVLMWSFIGLSGAMAIGGTILGVVASIKGVNLAFKALGMVSPVGTIKVLVAGMRAFSAVGMVGLRAFVTTLLSGLAPAVGGMLPLLGQAGLVGAVGLASYAITKWIMKLTGTDKGGIGSWLYDQIHGTDKERGHWTPPARKGSGVNGVPSSASTQTVQVNTQLNVDGRSLAQLVSTHQAKAASGPNTGNFTYDYLMAPVPVGM